MKNITSYLKVKYTNLVTLTLASYPLFYIKQQTDQFRECKSTEKNKTCEKQLI